MQKLSNHSEPYKQTETKSKHKTDFLELSKEFSHENKKSELRRLLSSLYFIGRNEGVLQFYYYATEMPQFMYEYNSIQNLKSNAPTQKLTLKQPPAVEEINQFS